MAEMQWPGVLALGTPDHCRPCEVLHRCVLHMERAEVKAFVRLPCQQSMMAALHLCADIIANASSNRFPHLRVAVSFVFKIKLG